MEIKKMYHNGQMTGLYAQTEGFQFDVWWIPSIELEAVLPPAPTTAATSLKQPYEKTEHWQSSLDTIKTFSVDDKLFAQLCAKVIYRKQFDFGNHYAGWFRRNNGWYTGETYLETQFSAISECCKWLGTVSSCVRELVPDAKD